MLSKSEAVERVLELTAAGNNPGMLVVGFGLTLEDLPQDRLDWCIGAALADLESGRVVD